MRRNSCTGHQTNGFYDVVGYRSPIDISYRKSISQKLREEAENYFMGEIQMVVNVDKDELLKALEYDRNQYEKGYETGYAKGVEDGFELARLRMKKCLKEWEEEND